MLRITGIYIAKTAFQNSCSADRVLLMKVYSLYLQTKIQLRQRLVCIKYSLCIQIVYADSSLI